MPCLPEAKSEPGSILCLRTSTTRDGLHHRTDFGLPYESRRYVWSCSYPRIGAKDAMAYMIAQVIGAVIASALILYVADNAAGAANPVAGGLGANGYGEHSPGLYSMSAAMLVEIVLTMFLVLTVLGSTDLKAPVGFAGIAIGLVLTLIHLVGIPITNTSVNPARSIGPAIFVGGWALQQLWLFIVAPLARATLASVVYGAMRIPGETITPPEAERALKSEQAERAAAAGRPS